MSPDMLHFPIRFISYLTLAFVWETSHLVTGNTVIVNFGTEINLQQLYRVAQKERMFFF